MLTRMLLHVLGWIYRSFLPASAARRQSKRCAMRQEKEHAKLQRQAEAGEQLAEGVRELRQEMRMRQGSAAASALPRIDFQAGPLVTATELDFYYLLVTQVLTSRHTVFVQVALSQLLHIPRQLRYISTGAGWFNRISRWSIDYLVCDTNTLEPIVAIELDDRSHRHESRQKRDQAVEQAFAMAGLPLLRVSVGSHMRIDDVRRQLQRYMQLNEAA